MVVIEVKGHTIDITDKMHRNVRMVHDSTGNEYRNIMTENTQYYSSHHRHPVMYVKIKFNNSTYVADILERTPEKARRVPWTLRDSITTSGRINAFLGFNVNGIDLRIDPRIFAEAIKKEKSYKQYVDRCENIQSPDCDYIDDSYILVRSELLMTSKGSKYIAVTMVSTIDINIEL